MLATQSISTAIDLDVQQQEVVESTIYDVTTGGRPQVSIGGLAGTGKTTIAKSINQGLKTRGMKVITLCPTGKAANVLRNKGVEADTIHSAIYNFKGKYKTDNGDDQIAWEEKGVITERPNIIMVDESSMVNRRVYHDLIALDTPIVWIGDHGQLPPVGGDPGIMRHPDFTLEKNYRQGKSEIVDYALAVREGYLLDTFNEVNQIHRVKWRDIIMEFDPDQAILGFNKSRVKYNQLYRVIHKHKGLINEGERIICINNNRRMGIYNGMQLIVKQITHVDTHIHAIVQDIDSPDREKEVRLRKSSFGQIKHETDDQEPDEIIADYGYGITCHKAQGSEWGKVLVFNQECPQWDMTRWLYTAATRAKDLLTVVG